MTHLSYETLNEYLDHRLTADVYNQARSHLEACPNCAASLNELCAILADLDSLPEVTMDVDFSLAIVARLEQTPYLPRPIQWLTVAQAVAASLAIILASQQGLGMIWPLVEKWIQPLNLPSLSENITSLTTFMFKVTADLRLSTSNFELPTSGINLTFTTLTIVIISASLLWLTANILLLNPHSRRTL